MFETIKKCNDLYEDIILQVFEEDTGKNKEIPTHHDTHTRGFPKDVKNMVEGCTFQYLVGRERAGVNTGEEYGRGWEC